MNLLLLLVAILAPLAPSRLAAPAAGKQESQPNHESAPAPGSDAQADPYLYEVILLRAAPGRLLDLVEAYQARITAFEEAALGEVHMMRHSQGDQWDLLLLVPMGDFERFFDSEQTKRRSDALHEVGGTGAAWAAKLDPLVAWREELFAFDLGLASDNLLTFFLAPVLTGSKTERRAGFFQQVEEELAAIPGVTQVSSSMVSDSV